MLLYFREKRLGDLSSATMGLLGFLRFATVTILAFLILGPLVRYLKTEIEPPTVVVAIDDSGSMVLGADSSRTRERLNNALAELSAGLGDEYSISSYTFGQHVNAGTDTTFKEPVTDMSALFESLKGRYANRNLGAIVLATDGIYNRGSNPRYALSGLNAPVYSIAFGDTVHRRDVRITEVAANRIAFLGNTFPVEARIGADMLEGETISYAISKDGEVLESGSFEAGSSGHEENVRFLVNAEQPGRQTFTISASTALDELTDVNNRRSVYIDVIDGRQKILILGRSPHPDIVALRDAVSESENYRVDVHFQNDAPDKLSDYDVLVLHQIPGEGSPQALLTKIANSDIPLFEIIGGQSRLADLDKLNLGISLRNARSVFNDVGGAVNEGFSLFKIKPGFDKFLADAPPLRSPFGEWDVSNAYEAALWQRVGNISTQDPLLLVNKRGDEKAAVLLGEGIWRWRLYDYARNENHKLFDSFFSSIIQYLSVKKDKRLFRVEAPANSMENEPLTLSAELYNAAYEPVNDAEVGIVFTDDEGKQFPFTFSRTAQAYRLDAGIMPVGNYTYRASVTRDGKEYSDSGSLTIRPFALEAAELKANHGLLNALAENSGGAMIYPNRVDSLIQKIKGSNAMQPVSYSTEVLSSVLNLKWPFFLLLFLLSLEWFIRKRAGHY